MSPIRSHHLRRRAFSAALFLTLGAVATPARAQTGAALDAAPGPPPEFVIPLECWRTQ